MQFRENCHLFFKLLHAYWLLFFRIGLGIVRIFSSAFYPPSAFSYPRFILYPHFLIRIFSFASVSTFYPYPLQGVYLIEYCKYTLSQKNETFCDRRLSLFSCVTFKLYFIRIFFKCLNQDFNCFLILTFTMI